MPDTNWLQTQAQRSLERLLPRLEPLLDNSADAEVFRSRLQTHFPALFRLLYSLYGHQYDFFYYLELILLSTAEFYTCRSAELKALDQRREAKPLWYQSESVIGGVCYVDLFAENVANLKTKIPYFKELGLTYLHLMPLFAVPEAHNDGGYAISDYRRIQPRLGTMQQLANLAADLRANGISLVLDFVFNHTADDHTWARKALEGDEEYQAYYRMFPDRTLPDQYEQHLREIFPEQAPGSFTYRPEIDRWVWTTFHNFQWDLNYANPAVFNAMLREMLFLTNQGVEVLRLDAVAFIWKQLGTSCENLPQAHHIIQAFNALVRVVAPTMLFKSEAIVHPDDVASYVSWQECPISYNPTLMALLWETLATREVKLLRLSMSRRFALPDDCAWVNYVRVHDDIGWTFADSDAAELGMNGFDHRQFLNQFYTGQFPGSFAVGLPFNYNPNNQDMRISGTAASLAGLEQGQKTDNALYIDHALKRLLLIHSVILSVGGIPLFYLGDEIATLNDYSYEQDPDKFDDSRWVHRPRFDWQRAVQRHDESTIPGRLFQSLCHLITVRKQTPAFANGTALFFDTGNAHVLGYLRSREIIVLANFSEHDQSINHSILEAYSAITNQAKDLITDNVLQSRDEITLEPYQFYWLRPLDK